MPTGQLDVKEGDIIVAASDGLFDNVFTDDIISITTSSIAGALKAGKSQLAANEAAAAALSELAYKHSQVIRGRDPKGNPYGAKLGWAAGGNRPPAAIGI
jgi:hypothetical protein